MTVIWLQCSGWFYNVEKTLGLFSGVIIRNGFPPLLVCPFHLKTNITRVEWMSFEGRLLKMPGLALSLCLSFTSPPLNVVLTFCLYGGCYHDFQGIFRRLKVIVFYKFFKVWWYFVNSSGNCRVNGCHHLKWSF